MKQTDGHHDPVCESVVFLSNFPHTQMPENTQRCETAGEDGTRRCKYVGRKIGEALRWVEDRDLLTMMLVFMCNTLVFVFSVSLRSSGHRCQRRKTHEEEDGGPQFDVANFDTNPSLIPEDDDAEDVASLRAKVVGGLKVIRDSRRRPQGDSPMGGEYADADIFETGMHGSLSSSPTAGDAKKAASKQQAEEDSELDLAKVSLEMLGLVNIACTSPPYAFGDTSIRADEMKAVPEIAAAGFHHTLLDGYYPLLNAGWRAGWRCLIDGTLFDILGVENDSQSKMTRVSVRLVTT